MSETTPPVTRTGEHPATNLEVKAAELTLSVRSLIQGIAAVATLLGVFFGGYFALIGRVEAATDAGVAVLSPRVIALENRAQAQEHATADLKGDVHELQLDVRELYRVIQTGARSARLEAPIPSPIASDGGQ